MPAGAHGLGSLNALNVAKNASASDTWTADMPTCNPAWRYAPPLPESFPGHSVRENLVKTAGVPPWIIPLVIFPKILREKSLFEKLITSCQLSIRVGLSNLEFFVIMPFVRFGLF